MSFKQRFFQPVDASSVIVFRIGFGVILLIEAFRYLSSNWIQRFYIEPEFHFKYYGFEWVTPWSGDGMYWHFIALAVLAFFILVGAFYRVSAILFFLGFSYVFLLDESRYLNHFYLVIVVALLMCVIPANRHLAVDAWLRPKLRSPSVPQWSVWLLRAQFEIVYLYAGIVKINEDWLQLEPLSMWLARRSDFPVLGPLFTQDWSVAVAAYGVIILHVIGAPLLLWRRTRLFIFILYCFFHFLNHFVFTIGIFPWFTLLGTLIFFDPDWPKQVRDFVLKRFGETQAPIIPAPSVNSAGAGETTAALPHPVIQNLLMGFFGVWILVQTLVPLRHFLYPGNVSWTEEGHRFAWQMKLRTKVGNAIFFITDPITHKTWEIDPRNYLPRSQARKLATHPDMILQYAHYLADIWREENQQQEVEVRAQVLASLNGRKAAPLIDPTRDLTKVERNLRHADWILPLNEPLNRQARAEANIDNE